MLIFCGFSYGWGSRGGIADRIGRRLRERGGCTERSTKFTAPSTKPVSIFVWTYDRTGNISSPSIIRLPG
jgi:hypothetical protein